MMNTGFELRHLRSFLVLADELHFGRAATRLHVAQPALSVQIRQLERALGVELLRRTSRSVTLTDAGHLFRDRAGALLQRLSTDVDEAGRVGRGESGSVHLGFITSATATVARLLGRVGAVHPGVDVTVTNGFTAQILADVVDGRADAGVVRDPDETGGLDVHPLLVDDFVAVIPADHRLADRSALTAHDLVDDPLILFPRRAGSLALVTNLSMFRLAGVDVTVAQELSDWGTIIALVGAGLGITVAPRSVTGLLPSSVGVLPIDGPQEASSIGLVVCSGDDRPPVATLVDAAHEIAVADLS